MKKNVYNQSIIVLTTINASKETETHTTMQSGGTDDIRRSKREYKPNLSRYPEMNVAKKKVRVVEPNLFVAPPVDTVVLQAMGTEPVEDEVPLTPINIGEMTELTEEEIVWLADALHGIDDE